MDRRPLRLVLRPVNDIKPSVWDRCVPHPLQTWEWGEFRKKTGLHVVRLGVFRKTTLVGGFQMTIHKIPHTPFSIGYVAKCTMPSQSALSELAKLGKKYNCIYIQIEPHVEKQNGKWQMENGKLLLRPSLSPTFAQHNFIIDVTQSEEQLLSNMHPKTRYNIKIAQRHGVVVQERTDTEGFETFLKLYFETTKRQHYFGHTPKYHRLLWETLQPAGIARVLVAYYSPRSDNQNIRALDSSEHQSISKSGKQNSGISGASGSLSSSDLPAGKAGLFGSLNPVPLTAWMIFKLNDTLYYPYGGSSDEYRNVMANNLVAWEAIKLAKKLKTKQLDLWGSLGENADPNHSWYGFHRFKQGYGGRLVTYTDSHDLILNPLLYWAFQLTNKLRWLLLRT